MYLCHYHSPRYGIVHEGISTFDGLKVIDPVDALVSISCFGLVDIVFTFTIRTLMNSGSLLVVVDVVGWRSENSFMMIDENEYIIIAISRAEVYVNDLCWYLIL